MNFATFSAELIRQRSRRSGGLVAIEQVESTQVLGRRIVEEYTREGTRVPETDILAWRQVAGHGRQGRSWSSPPGHGVYATLIRSRHDHERLQTLPLVVAVALAKTLNRYLHGRCRLKWPNDLLVGEHKIGGILIEVITPGSTAAIGFGVNYGADLATIGEPRITSLLHELGDGERPSLAALALELIAELDAELERDASADEVIARYEELSNLTPGQTLRCRIDGELLEGRFAGFDEHGFLRLETPDGERVLSTGEVLVRG